ncbi:hypothetical protein TanjilG_09147 [Lupinus angustifolius]|uniref:Bidirectional sugar transporter SWEET n=1 Tax=Lupinus angustifolius TaxID=3871 RepID=A0A1J7I111_LUPAN|nr:PREDICTED: bidirectional sugar transporter N3-like [Lupinus angustifolius]OIW18953.1 hypothetical protein TanjilG_09147 [Lupinus angustifolius]
MALLGIHNTLALTFGILGNIISFLVYLTPMPTFIRIYKKKSTESFQSLPYLVALFSSMLWLYYAYLKTDAILLVTINSIGCAIEIIYITMYIVYAPKTSRSLTIKLFMAMNVGTFTLIPLISYFALPSSSLRVKVVGWICVSVSVSVFAAPLSIVAHVIRTKSVEFMPFWLSFFLTLSAIMWFAYGAFLKDICIAIPNVLGFTLGLLQMLLYVIYKKGPAIKNDGIEEREQELDPMRDIVVGIPLSTREVILISINDHVNEPGKVDAKKMENSVEINNESQM